MLYDQGYVPTYNMPKSKKIYDKLGYEKSKYSYLTKMNFLIKLNQEGSFTKSTINTCSLKRIWKNGLSPMKKLIQSLVWRQDMISLKIHPKKMLLGWLIAKLSHPIHWDKTMSGPYLDLPIVMEDSFLLIGLNGPPNLIWACPTSTTSHGLRSAYTTKVNW